MHNLFREKEKPKTKVFSPFFHILIYCFLFYFLLWLYYIRIHNTWNTYYSVFILDSFYSFLGTLPLYMLTSDRQIGLFVFAAILLVLEIWNHVHYMDFICQVSLIAADTLCFVPREVPRLWASTPCNNVFHKVCIKVYVNENQNGFYMWKSLSVQ